MSLLEIFPTPWNTRLLEKLFPFYFWNLLLFIHANNSERAGGLFIAARLCEHYIHLCFLCLLLPYLSGN